MKKNQTDTADKISHTWLLIIFWVGLILNTPSAGLAQGESPLPGNNIDIPDNNSPSTADKQTNTATAPLPGSGQSDKAPVNISTIIQSESKLPANAGSTESLSAPVSLTAWQACVQDLKNSGATEEVLNKYLSWLDSLIKAHNKLAATFSKQENTAAVCNNEHNLSKQFCLVKDQILYLKANLLIKENRLCEAVTILSNITATEPESSLGQQSYKRLVEIGFSPKPTTAAAKPTITVNNHQSSHNLPKPMHPTPKTIHPNLKRQSGILAR